MRHKDKANSSAMHLLLLGIGYYLLLSRDVKYVDEKKKKKTCWHVYTIRSRPGHYCVYAAGKLEFIQQSLSQWRVRQGNGRALGRAPCKLYFFYKNAFFWYKNTLPFKYQQSVCERGKVKSRC